MRDVIFQTQSLQRTMGRLLFWGTQGLKRDLRAAAEYYRIGAESNDPGALFDYAIVRMRVSHNTYSSARLLSHRWLSTRLQYLHWRYCRLVLSHWYVAWEQSQPMRICHVLSLIDLGNGLMPSGNKSLSEPTLAYFVVAVWHHYRPQ